MRRPLILLLLLLALSSASVLAQTPAWFAKPALLAEPTGQTHPAASSEEILRLAEQLAPGATLLIEPGTYKLSRTLVLRDKKNITIRSLSGNPASVTLTGKGWEHANQRDDILHISAGCDGVTIAGITFAESRTYGIKVEAENAPKNIHIYNCRFRNIGVRAIKGSAGQDPNTRAHNGSVRFCDFENTKIPPADWLFGGDYISAIDMMALDDWTFSDNIFSNINGRNGGARAAIFIWVRSRKVVVERNIIVNCDRGIAFGNPGQSTANQPGEQLTYVANGIIRNNFIAGGPDCGIELWHVDGIKLWHNSIWRPERNFGRGIRIGTGTRNTEIANNLVHGRIQFEGGQARTNNNLAGRLENYFVDPAAGNLALTPEAKDAIDKGADSPQVPRDIKGAPRKNAADLGAWEYDSEKRAWVEPMRKVHARFQGRTGTLAQFGDSITISGAYWSPLASKPKNMNPETERAWELLKARLRPECFHQKGPEFGNQGSMTIQWARKNIGAWLKRLNPEAAVIMFGSNDVHKMDLAEFEKSMREVLQACLDNGTVPILTTPPPQTAKLEKCSQFVEAIRQIATELQLPLIDYFAEILERRPADWDGAAAQFKNIPGDTYDVPTLISRDGVHPSNPQRHVNDFSEQALNQNGYTLRNYLTLMRYSEVVTEVIAR